MKKKTVVSIAIGLYTAAYTLVGFWAGFSMGKQSPQHIPLPKDLSAAEWKWEWTRVETAWTNSIGDRTVIGMGGPPNIIMRKTE